MTAPRRAKFAIDGELPNATTVIEASAGTGKTFTIAALATRYVAERGHTMRDLMIVTFSRLATAELRSRIFDRLRHTRDALAAFAANGTTPDDPVDRLLCADPKLVSLRLSRVDAALNSMDAATIATTHEFCAAMLSELGVLADHDRASTLVRDPQTIVAETLADVYLDMCRDPKGAGYTAPPFNLEVARSIAKAVTQHASAGIEPPQKDHIVMNASQRLAVRVREQLDATKRRRNLHTYDDLISRVLDALTNQHTAAAAAQLLSTRFPVVLIDEFQDTDPAQWDVVRRAFVGRSTVVLIGDPKQSIYAFRDADVAAYLDAVQGIDTVLTLPTNYRSDAPTVNAVHQLFRGAALGDRIVEYPLQAHHPARSRAPEGSSWAFPLRIRAVNDDAQITSWNTHGDLIVRDTAKQVTDLLASGTQLVTPDEQRRVTPGDIAVLVQQNSRGQAIYESLRALGQPAVFSGTSSVFAGAAASDWRCLLLALSESNPQLATKAAMTSLIGWAASDLAAADSERHGELTLLFGRLKRLLADSGISAIWEWLGGHTDLYERLLSSPDGERILTDLRHVSEELDRAQRRWHLGVPTLLAWLDDRMKHASGDSEAEVRRIETERDAVHIMTIHRAKGLEFPFVMLPDVGAPFFTPRSPFVTHDESGRRLVVDANEIKRLEKDHWSAEAAEALRKLYVGVTRARCGVTVWWLNTPSSPLQRLLYGNQGEGREPRPSVHQILVPPDGLNLDPALIHVSRIDPTATKSLGVPESPVADPTPQVLGWPPERRAFTRVIDRSWTRTSYSGLTADSHESPVAISSHEPDESVDVEPITQPLANSEHGSRLVSLPGGTVFGSLVHGVLERVDPAADDLATEMTLTVTDLMAQLPVPGLDAEALAAGLVDVVRTPLGPLTGGLSLADLGARHRLAELDFEMPLCQLSPGHRRPIVDDIAALWNDPSLVPPDDPLAAYGRHLATCEAATTVLAGFLTGSIDAVLRVGTPDDPRYVIVDYKTNRLPVRAGEVLDARHYTQAAMAQAMMAAHYPLQALLYGVALHRMMTLRQPGYRPDHHLAGVGYLFVRGMVGSVTPTERGLPQGVFTWCPPAGLVTTASEVISGHLIAAGNER